jgi:DNA repair protein RadA/Sms
MSKDKIVFLCKSCGMDYPKAYGKCPSCGAWNSFAEQKVHNAQPEKIPHGYLAAIKKEKPQLIHEISITKEIRLDTTSNELNRVLGGGLVLGSMTLIGGEPGIGKSTLVLQIALQIKEKKVLYVSGE